jgi:hypothetical protein
MPVTAKFSREFYDKFGHDVVDELVNYLNQIDSGYRSELKELNELNFARFDAKLDQRVAQFEGALERRIGQAESRLIRWTFALWAPTMLAVVGLMIGVLVKL